VRYLAAAEDRAKLAALVPPPRAHLTRVHGVFAPNANLRAPLTPSGRGKRSPADEGPTGANNGHRSPDEKRRSMTWGQRLKRVFNINVSTCGHCGGTVRIVASIEEPTAIRTILAHFAKHGTLEKAHYRSAARAPPAAAARRPAGHEAEGETRQDDTKRERTRRAALGLLSGIGNTCPPTAARSGPAMPKPHSRTSEPLPNRRLSDDRPLARLSGKGV